MRVAGRPDVAGHELKQEVNGASCDPTCVVTTAAGLRAGGRQRETSGRRMVMVMVMMVVVGETRMGFSLRCLFLCLSVPEAQLSSACRLRKERPDDMGSNHIPSGVAPSPLSLFFHRTLPLISMPLSRYRPRG